MSMLADWGRCYTGEVKADASAALGIISRRGLGKVRHLDTSFLWIQEIKAKRSIEFSKVLGASNTADLMTKHLAYAVMDKHFSELQLRRNQERPSAASKLK